MNAAESSAKHKAIRETLPRRKLYQVVLKKITCLYATDYPNINGEQSFCHWHLFMKAAPVLAHLQQDETYLPVAE